MQWGQISDFRLLVACRPISLKFKDLVPLCIDNNPLNFVSIGRMTASGFNQLIIFKT